VIAPVTPLERVLGALTRRPTDRVPMALTLGLHAGGELGLTLKQVFSDPALVVEGALRLRAKYGSDAVQGTWYAPIEHEAWGGDLTWYDDGPPNAGAPVVRDVEDIVRLEPPRVEDNPRILAMLASIADLRERLGPDVPILGGVVSPFSLPVMQLGFEAYLGVLLERRDLWDRLMLVNEAWTVAWGNAQLAAGASALAYFDAVASATIVPPELYAETGAKVATRTISRLNGGTITMLASGRAMPVLPHLLETGTLAIGPSTFDPLPEVVDACRGRATVVGNLNGIAMRHWTPAQAESEVRRLLRVAGRDGNLIVCDNHGEIPLSVPDEVIHAIAEAVRTWGRFPMDWAKE
jgi:uroporphyrinogen decarboxylase